MEILTVLTAIWRRKAVVFASLFLFVVLGVVLSLFTPRLYQADALLQITAQDETASLLSDLGMSEIGMTLTSGDEEIQDKIYIALAPPVMEEVVWKLQLRDSDGYLYEYDDVNNVSIVSPLLGKPGFEITQEQGTSVLVVTAFGTSKEGAVLMADTLADIYIQQTTETARQETSQAQEFIAEQIKKVEKELDDVYQRKASAQERAAVIDMEYEIKAAVQRISDLNMESQLVSATAAETRGKIAQIRRGREKEANLGGTPTSMQDSPIIHEARSKKYAAIRERDGFLGHGYTDRAPEIVNLNADIKAAQDVIDAEIARMREFDPEIATLEESLNGLERKQEQMRSLALATTSEFATFPARMREVASLDLASDAISEVYKSLADQQYQIGVAEAMTMSDTRVLARAKVPEKHSSPSAILNLVGAIFLGLGFGVAGALALEYVDDTVEDADSIRKVWDLPQLGVIFRYAHKQPLPAVAVLPATDPIAEAYRTVRNSLEFASLDTPIKLLGFTSCIPGEGKSTTAVNVAISLAREGKRVLMVDCDMRLPTQHKQFPATVLAPGLVEVLTRTQSAEVAVQPTPVDGLFLLAAGDPPPDPGQLIESLRMRQTLLDLARGYDVVVVDAPPVLAVNDAIVLNRTVDAMVLVVESGKATRRMLAEVKSRFERVKAAPVGIVVNKMKSSTNLYGAYAKQYQRAAEKRKARGEK